MFVPNPIAPQVARDGVFLYSDVCPTPVCDAFRYRRLLALTALTLTTAPSACTRSSAPATTPTQTREAREQAYAANNVGVAPLEQLNYADAVGGFARR